MQTRLCVGGQFVDGPARGTPHSSLRLAELIADVGFPPGVVNIVPGYGREMGFEAMPEYTQPKPVWVNVGGEVPDWYGS